jgi:anti-sigma-K factor RskA
MSGHEQFGEDLALYALNALEGEDRAKLESHLATCAACRLELEQLRGDGALMALSTMGPKPPARAKQRLMEAVAKERLTALNMDSQPSKTAKGRAAMSVPPRTSSRQSWWGWLGWAATAAVIVFAASLWKENLGLKQALNSSQVVLSRTEREMEEFRRVAGPILDSSSQRVTLVSVKTPPQPQGKAFYLRNRSSLVFVANNLLPLPPQKAYELWLIPTQGAPIPAGVFKPDGHGSATVVNPPLPAGAEAKAFAITVENEAGSSTPTMPIVMMGTGE